MAGQLNPVVLIDIMDSLDFKSNERLLVYECLREIIEVESISRDKKESSSKQSNKGTVDAEKRPSSDKSQPRPKLPKVTKQ